MAGAVPDDPFKTAVLTELRHEKDFPGVCTGAMQRAEFAAVTGGRASRPLESPGSKAPGAVYVGETISLNFQGVEVRTVLQLLADFTGFNLVVSDAVQGSVTLNLQDVP